eukprot:7097937-Pyramimonas_sp.AAC.1
MPLVVFTISWVLRLTRLARLDRQIPSLDIWRLMGGRFTYRDSDALNSTTLGLQSGTYGSFYGQDGYAMDLVPNIAPHWYASGPPLDPLWTPVIQGWGPRATPLFKR